MVNSLDSYQNVRKYQNVGKYQNYEKYLYDSGFQSNLNMEKQREIGANAFQRYLETQAEERARLKGRSVLDRGFDLLLAPIYGVAGFADGAIQQMKNGTDDDPWLAWRQAGQGLLHGLNVFNNVADEEHEYTFGKVLETAGWQPESGLGKFAKGTVGFLLDVFLDPTTYISGGASAVIKGTGRTKAVEELVNASKTQMYDIAYKNAKERALINKPNASPDLIEKYATKQATEIADRAKNATHMTEEMAEQLIERRALDQKWGISKAEIKQDAKMLSDKYNSLMGIRDAKGAKPVTFGIANAPFGEKYAHKFGSLGKTVTLSSGNTARKIGDTIGTARAYSALRSKIYGGAIGKKFSNTSTLYRLGKEDPAKLYDFMKQADLAKKNTAAIHDVHRVLRDTAKAMEIDLKPHEQKELIRLLEDPANFKPIYQTIKFSDTKTGLELQKALEKRVVRSKEQLRSYEERKNNIQQLIKDKQIEKKQAQAELSATINELYDMKKELNNMGVVARADLQRQLSELQITMKNLDGQKFLRSGVPREEYEQIKGLQNAYKDAKVLDAEYQATKAPRMAETARLEDGTPVTKIATDDAIDTFLDANPTNVRQAKWNLIEKLSDLMYGEKDKLSKMMPDSALDDLIDGFEKGHSLEYMRNIVSRNPSKYSGHAKEVYQHIAKKYGYKSWKEFYIDPMKTLQEKKRLARIKYKGTGDDINGLTKEEQELWDYLTAVARAREADFHLYFHEMNLAQWADVQKQTANSKMWNELEEVQGIDVLNKRRDTFEAASRSNTKGEIKPDTQEFEKFYDGKTLKEFYVDEIPDIKEFVKHAFIRERLNHYSKQLIEKGEIEPMTTIKVKDEFKMIPVKEYVDAKGKLVRKRLRYKNNKPYKTLPHEFKEQGYKWVEAKETDLKPNEFDVIVEKGIKPETLDAYKTQIIQRVQESKFLDDIADRVIGILATKYNGGAYPKHWDELTDESKLKAYRSAAWGARNQDKEVKEVLNKMSERSKARIQKYKERKELMESLDFADGVFYKGEIGKSGLRKSKYGVIESFTDDGFNRIYRIRNKDGSVVEVPIEDISRKFGKDKGNTTASLKVLDDLRTREAQTVDEYFKEVDMMNKSMDNLREQLVKIDMQDKVMREAIAQKESLHNRYVFHINQYNDELKLFNRALRDVEGTTNPYEVIKRIERLEDAMKSDDALRYYAMVRYGPQTVKNAMQVDTGHIVLDYLGISDKQKEWAKYLYEEFRRMGTEEVSIGKLGQDQFQAMLGRYFPHMITDDGAEYLSKQKNIDGRGVGLTDEYGYGRAFNNFAISRTTEGKTVQEINDHFRKILKGKNMLSESVHDIYVARALKHEELMYDDAYMREMMAMFGTPVTADSVLKEGYKYAMNYGQFKEKLYSIAYRQLAIQKQKQQKQAGRRLNKQQALQQVAVTSDAMNPGDIKDMVLKLLADWDIDPRVLDDFAKPMIELNEQQAKRLANLGTELPHMIDENILHRTNRAREIQIQRDQSKFLTMYDRFTRWMKLNQTSTSPAFYMRNKMGGVFNTWMATGFDALNPRMQYRMIELARHKGDLSKLKDKTPLPYLDSNGVQQVIHLDELYELAKRHGGIDEGFFAKDLGADTASRGLIKALPRKFDPTDTENFFIYKQGANFGSISDNSDRLMMVYSAMKRGMTPEEGVELTKKWLFDYSDLTYFEHTVMKRLMPYYTWLRKNGRLQVGEFIENPGKYQMIAKVMEGINSMPNEDERVNDEYMSDFARDWIQLPFFGEKKFDDQGNVISQEPILLSPNLPFMDLSRFPNPLNLFASDGAVDEILGLLSQTNPLIKNPLELGLNHNFFFDNKIRDEENTALQNVGASADHVGRQLALYTAISDAVQKEGGDKARHIANYLTGIKTLSYDYETSRRMKLKEQFDKSEQLLLDKWVEGAYDGIATLTTRLGDEVSSQLKNAAVELIGKPPTNPGEYQGALSPISLTTYNNLSDEEKKKYQPPTKEDATVFHIEAVRKEQEELAKTGKVKKYLWTLLDAEVDLSNQEMAYVKQVTDGDTLKVMIGDKEENVRLLLVDTPESAGEYADEPMPFGKEASNFSKQMLFGKDVKLIIEGYDVYGRVLAYVEIDGEDHNRKLLEEGLAKVRYADGDEPRLQDYYNTERKAQRNNRGIWSIDGYARPRTESEGFNLNRK